MAAPIGNLVCDGDKCVYKPVTAADEGEQDLCVGEQNNEAIGTRALEGLFGKELLAPNGKGRVGMSEALSGVEVVGIYFSAHWCPPCRGFTPLFSERYLELKAAGKSLEVVFVSSDSDQESFESYHSEMPWLALPFDHRDTAAELSRKYSVTGIPTLVFIDGSTGELITEEGREGICSDSYLAEFPYHA